MHKFAITLLCTIFTFSSFAGNAKQSQYAMQLVQCASYFLILAEQKQRDGQDDIVEELRDTASKTMQLSAMLTNMDTLKDNFKYSNKHQIALIDHDFSDLQVLNNQYQVSCTEMLAEPDQRVSMWLSQRR